MLGAVTHQGHIHGKGGLANVKLKANRFTWVLGKLLGTIINNSPMKILHHWIVSVAFVKQS